MLDLNSLALFVHVAEANSFSETARRINMPVSTVSRRIAELEQALGVRLFERSTRHLRLTDVGAEILGRCRQGLEAFEDVENLVTNRRDEVRGTLRLSCPPSVGDTLLAPLVSAYRASYPGVRVEVLVTERQVDLIAERVDVALRVGELRDSALVMRPVLRYRHVMLASPAYLVRHGEPTHPQSLKDHAIAAFAGWNTEPVWELVNEGQTERTKLSPLISANDYALIEGFALRAEAIIELPAIACLVHMSSGELVEVMKPWSFPTVTLSLLHLSRTNMSRVVRLFIDFAAAHVRAVDLPLDLAPPAGHAS